MFFVQIEDVFLEQNSIFYHILFNDKLNLANLEKFDKEY